MREGGRENYVGGRGAVVGGSGVPVLAEGGGRGEGGMQGLEEVD